MSGLNTENLFLFGPGSEWFWSMLHRQGVEPNLTREFILDPVRLNESISSLEDGLRDLEAERSVFVQPR